MSTPACVANAFANALQTHAACLDRQVDVRLPLTPGARAGYFEGRRPAIPHSHSSRGALPSGRSTSELVNCF